MLVATADDGAASTPWLFTSLLAVCLIGLVTNVLSAIVLTHNKAFRNPFGMLTTVNAVGNLGVLLVFTFWASPIILVGFSSSADVLNRRLGQFSLFFCELAFHSALFISINRLMAISSPHFYRRYFTNRLTGYIIVFIIIIASLYMSVFFFFDGCNFYFDYSSHAFTFDNTACGDFISTFVDLGYNVTLFIVILCFDMVTLTLLRKASTRLATSNDSNRKRESREIRFFLQAFTNTIVFVGMLISFHIVNGYACQATDDICQFLTTSLAWAGSHTCGGLILVLFNKEIRRLFTNPRRLVSLMFESKSSTGNMVVTQRKSDDVAVVS